MNLFSSPEFLGAVADVYFKGQRMAVEDVRVGDQVLRLLVAGDRVITNARFVDYHAPLAGGQPREPARKVASVPYVTQGIVELAEWESGSHSEFLPSPYVDWS